MTARRVRLGLAGKLILGVTGVSLLAVFIAGAAYRVSSGPAFQQLVIDEAEEHFVGDVTAYYRQTGTLAGMGPWLAAGRNMLTESGPVVPVAGAPPPPPTGGIVAFGLVDPSGLVVLGGAGQYAEGEPAPSDALSGSKPIVLDGTVIGRILYPRGPAPPNQAQQAYAARINTALGLAAITGVLAALAVGILLARGILQPVRRLTVAARQVAAGQVAQTVEARGNDELAELAMAFNTMSHGLARYEQARRQMAADIAHELRTPLTTISGYVEAIRDGELTPTYERLDSIYRQSNRLARLIEDLRVLSLAEVGALHLNRARISVGELIVESVRAYEVTATQRGLGIRADVGQEVPEVEADPGRIQQVIEILVNNALRHTEAGEIVVSAGVEEDGAVIRVADTGSGIEPEVLPRLFDRFYRGEQARARDNQGSGLGLAIAKAIVSAHDGSIAVASQLAQGTVFTIRLPLAV